MNVNLPSPPSANPFLANLVNALRTAFLNVMSTQEAAGRLMLRSATSGAVYQVTVDDDTDPMAPVLVLTLQDGKGRV